MGSRLRLVHTSVHQLQQGRCQGPVPRRIVFLGSLPRLCPHLGYLKLLPQATRLGHSRPPWPESTPHGRLCLQDPQLLLLHLPRSRRRPHPGRQRPRLSRRVVNRPLFPRPRLASGASSPLKIMTRATRRRKNCSWGRDTCPPSLYRGRARLAGPTLPIKCRRSWGIVLWRGGEAVQSSSPPRLHKRGTSHVAHSTTPTPLGIPRPENFFAHFANT